MRCLNAAAAAFAQRVRYEFRWTNEDRQVCMFWHVADLRIGREPKILAATAADRIEFCLEIVAHHQFHDPAPEDVRGVGSADDGNRVRREKGF